MRSLALSVALCLCGCWSLGPFGPEPAPRHPAAALHPPDPVSLYRLRAGAGNLSRRGRPQRIHQPRPTHCLRHRGKDVTWRVQGEFRTGSVGTGKASVALQDGYIRYKTRATWHPGGAIQDPLHQGVHHVAGRRRDRRPGHGRGFARAQAGHRRAGGLRHRHVRTLMLGAFNGEGQNVTANTDSTLLWVGRATVRPVAFSPWARTSRRTAPTAPATAWTRRWSTWGRPSRANTSASIATAASWTTTAGTPRAPTAC